MKRKQGIVGSKSGYIRGLMVILKNGDKSSNSGQVFISILC